MSLSGNSQHYCLELFAVIPAKAGIQETFFWKINSRPILAVARMKNWHRLYCIFKTGK